MKLLNVLTLKFGEFYDLDIPPYYILSHRWSWDEISYKEFIKDRKVGLGYWKILDFCDFVKTTNPEIEWVWVDTCCTAHARGIFSLS